MNTGFMSTGYLSTGYIRDLHRTVRMYTGYVFTGYIGTAYKRHHALVLDASDRRLLQSPHDDIPHRIHPRRRDRP